MHSAIDMSAGANPTFDELAKQLGVKSDTPFFDQREIIAKGIGKASLEAAFNLTVASKGRSHAALTAVDPMALATGRNPVDGKELPLPSHMRTVDKLVVVSNHCTLGNATDSRHPCQLHFWCLHCNATEILKAAVEISWEDITKGRVEFSDAMMAAIRPIASDGGDDSRFCCCQGKRMLGQPPMGYTLLCPNPVGCPRWLDTPKSQPMKGCTKCAVRFGAELPKELIPDLAKSTSITSQEAQIDALKYAYLRMRGGDSELENFGARAILNLGEARVALNEVRSKPIGFATRISFGVTLRIIAWLLTWKWDRTGLNGLCLFDFQTRHIRALPPFSRADLNKASADCDAQKHPPPESAEPFPVEPDERASEEEWDR